MRLNPDNTLVLFASPEDFFAVMLGAPQHDAHMRAFRIRRNLDRMAAQGDALAEVAAEMLAETHEREAQRVAKDYDYNTASLRSALHRWTAGCFAPANIALCAAAPDYRAARIRQLTRALDIAIEHHQQAA
jgi:NAD(P)H-hydrate repair Nnr-like enzyme with NAD(P)H-hydrate dehydratase domain